MLLLNPGPVTLTERVRRSLLQEDLCHRESEFFDVQEEARTRLVGVYDLDPAQWQAVLMTGSGTAAVESMISTLVPANGKLLIVENGVYGERITAIARQYGIAHKVVKHDWMQAPDLARITAALDAGETITHVAIIHHETTTGRLNDLRALGEACRARRADARGRREQLRCGSDRLRRHKHCGGGRNGEQMPARRAGRGLRGGAPRRARTSA